MSSGDWVGLGLAQISTTGLSLAIANPTSYQILGLSLVMSARQMYELWMMASMSSINMVAPGSSSTRYGSRSASLIAGAKTSLYRLSNGPRSNGWMTKHLGIIATPATVSKCDAF